MGYCGTTADPLPPEKAKIAPTSALCTGNTSDEYWMLEQYAVVAQLVGMGGGAQLNTNNPFADTLQPTVVPQVDRQTVVVLKVTVVVFVWVGELTVMTMDVDETGRNSVKSANPIKMAASATKTGVMTRRASG